MTRKIVHEKPVAGGEPAVQIKFKGPYQVDYFSLRKAAREDFGVTQTELGRKIISEWLKRYRTAVKGNEEKTVRQMTLALELGNGKLRTMGKAQEGRG